MNAPLPGGLDAIKIATDQASRQSAGPGATKDGTLSLEGVQQTLLALSSSPELREAAVAEMVVDLAKVVDGLNLVEKLMRATDEQLTGRLEEIRQAAEQFVAAAVRHETAFKGELAVKAAQLARREATEALSAELIKLQQLIVVQQQPRTSWRTIGMTVVLTAAVTIILVGTAITSFRHVIGGA